MAAPEDGAAAVPWDDGRTKAFEEKLAAPDVEDLFSIPYRSGPIQPVTAADDDPGRIRVDALFQATYGHSEEEVRRSLVPVEILGQRLMVHRRAQAAFQRVAARLEALVRADAGLRPFLEHLGGTFLWRKIANTDRQSAHSYGVSLDLNVRRSHYWEWQKPKDPVRWRNAIPQAIVDAFEAEGFIWGGRWYHYDTMHFELRPELVDPRCRWR
ncbi:MAG TPA: M15 family metallopeptidase [Myxococcales bacterium]|nr:M15 family metallopeptidase [Myxococcales bacterium]